MLLILKTPTDTANPPKLADLFEALGQRTELTDQVLQNTEDDDVDAPRCPHCGSSRVRFLSGWPRFGGP